MVRPIVISNSPNTESDDVLLALKCLFKPISWFNYRETEKLENNFTGYFGKKYQALAVNSGRSALYLILKAMNFERDSSIAIQAMTCVAVPNAIIWNKLKPLYIDVDKSFNMDPSDLERKIDERVKAVIVQHSFGVACNLDKIVKICRKNHLLLIEDCAVALGGNYKNKKLGTLGDVAFFSFGRDKIISSVFGGMILCHNFLYPELKRERDNLDYPKFSWVIQQLLHPIFFKLVLPIYNLGFWKLRAGRLLIYLAQKLKIISKAVYKAEMYGVKPKVFPLKMPGVLAKLADHQFDKLYRFNTHRIEIAALYDKEIKKLNLNISLPKLEKGAIWLRYPILCSKKREILRFFNKRGIVLGDWYSETVVPVKRMEFTGYLNGSCPKAENYSRMIVNLPTYPLLTKADAVSIINLIKVCPN